MTIARGPRVLILVLSALSGCVAASPDGLTPELRRPKAAASFEHVLLRVPPLDACN
jgi:hypothetical protein